MATYDQPGKSIPFDVALKRARIRYLCGNEHPQTTEELIRRRCELREYITMKRIQAIFDADLKGHIEHK